VQISSSVEIHHVVVLVFYFFFKQYSEACMQIMTILMNVLQIFWKQVMIFFYIWVGLQLVPKRCADELSGWG